MAALATLDSNAPAKLKTITAENGMRTTENIPSENDVLKIRPTTAPHRIPFMTQELPE